VTEHGGLGEALAAVPSVRGHDAALLRRRQRLPDSALVAGPPPPTTPTARTTRSLLVRLSAGTMLRRAGAAPDAHGEDEALAEGRRPRIRCTDGADG